jgi:hypothetical protein
MHMAQKMGEYGRRRPFGQLGMAHGWWWVRCGCAQIRRWWDPLCRAQLDGQNVGIGGIAKCHGTRFTRKRNLGVPQVTSDGADEGDDHGGGCLALSILVGGEPSRRRGQLCGRAVHLDLFAGILWGGGGVDPTYNESSPLLADVRRDGGQLGQGITDDPSNGS